MVLWKRLGSLKLSVALLALLFLTVLGGTLAQAAWGSAAVQTTLFGRLVFEAGGWWWPGLPLLLALTGVNLTVGALTKLERSGRALGLWGVHLALVLACFGSLGFALAQREWVLGLVPGASADRAFVKGSTEVDPLPFRLRVDSFRVETYPGSVEPSDYVSLVTVGVPGRERSAEVRMNQPLRQDGWAVYQSSVQTVEGVASPVFKLTHNPWAPFPYVVSVLLVGSLGLHGVLVLVGRRRGTRRG